MGELKIGGMLVLLFCSGAAAYAQEPEPAPTVEIKGIRDPDWKPYSAMLKGVKKFSDKHALAPTSELKFILIPRRPDVDMQGLQLKLEDGENSSAIPLNEMKVFTLPVDQNLLKTKAELTINRKAGLVRWLPYVRSAATTDTTRRMGDLRLTCEVHWAIDKETLPFAMRSAVSALGGACNPITEKISYGFIEAKRIISATITYKGRSERIPVDGDTFTPPLRDENWGDDSLIELEFEKS